MAKREIINEVVSQQAFKDLDELIKKLEQGRLKLVEVLSVSEKADFSKLKLPSDLQRELKKYEDRQNKINQELEKQRKINDQLKNQIERTTTAKRKSNQRTSEEIENNRILSRNAREYARLSSRLATEYEKQSTRLNQLKRVQKGYLIQQENGVKLTKEEALEMDRLGKEIDQLDRKLKKVDRAVGENFRNVGNYGSVWGRVGRLVTAATAAFGVYSALDIGREVYQQVKEINSLNAALLEVTETQEDFNRTTQYLIELADQSGARINSLEKTYTSFFASAKMTNLTLEETQELFTNVVLAQTKLGRSNDDIVGGLRALEQMLSKGNVQAEEIRGQLGERLPGAFNILAKSMGLTTQELNKQLELGEVIAEEVLPKFARELANVYGVDTQTRIENLTASENRMRDEWNLFVRDLEGGEGRVSRVFMSLFDGISFVVEGLRYLNDGDNIRQQSTYNDVLKRQTEYYKELGEEAEAYAKINASRATTAINSINEEIRAKEKHIETLKEDSKWMLKSAREVYKTNQEIDDLRINLSRETAIRNAASRQLIDHTDWLEKNKEAEKKDNDSKRAKIKTIVELNEVQKYSVGYYEQVISALQKEQKNVSKSTVEWNNYQKSIEEAQKAIQIIQDLEGFARTELAPDEDLTNEITKVLTSRGIEDGMKRLAEITHQTVDDLYSEFASIYDWDFDNFVKYSESKISQKEKESEKIKELQESVVNEAVNLGNAYFQAEVEKVDLRIEKNRDAYAQILDNAELTEERRRAIEAERDANERKLMKEKRKREREQFIFEKSISLAKAVINVAEAITEYGVISPQAILAGIVGALQIATIATQSIPKFEKGTENAPGGWAMVDEKGAELHLDKYNRIKSWGNEGGANYRYLEKGDKIKTAQETMKLRSYSDVESMVYQMNMQNQGLPVSENNFDLALLREVSGLRQDNQALKKSISSLGKRPVNVNNTVVIDDKRPFY